MREQVLEAVYREGVLTPEEKITEIEHIALDRIRSTQPEWRR